MSAQPVSPETPSPKLTVAASSGDAEALFLADISRMLRDSAESEPAWLTDIRVRARDEFARQGFPHKRVEAWKYTDLRARLTEPLAFPSSLFGATLPGEGPSEEQGSDYRISLVNGQLRRDLSALSGLPDGVTIRSLTEQADQDPKALEAYLSALLDQVGRPMVGLNVALMSDALSISVADGVIVDKPLILDMTSTVKSGQHHPHILLSVGEGAAITVFEHYAMSPDGSGLTNVVMSQSVGPKAQLRHYKVQQESYDRIHVASVLTSVAKDAVYDNFTLTEGSALSRQDGYHRCDGEEADISVNGAYMLTGYQHGDMTTFVDHAVPNCNSREVFHGVLTERSRGVVQGKILVRDGAQHTDANFLSKALLLSDRAEMDAKPELEIYADDVKCAHGATTGELDEDALFYLRSRGLPEAAAKALLIEGFLDNAIDEVSDEAGKTWLKRFVANWLGLHMREATGLDL